MSGFASVSVSLILFHLSSADDKLCGLGGEGTVVSLCAGSVHRMMEPIVMTARGQVLETEGGGGGEDGWGRALLRVEGEEQSMAIK